jgi:adenosine deaminase
MMDRRSTSDRARSIVERRSAAHRRGRGRTSPGRAPAASAIPTATFPRSSRRRARRLGVTIHVGEEGEEHGDAEISEVVGTCARTASAGILAARNPELMAALRERRSCSRILPTSNLLTRALGRGAVRETLRAFVEERRRLHDATDGPEMMRTHLRDEFELLQRIGALDEDELAEANRRGHEASFVRAASPART